VDDRRAGRQDYVRQVLEAYRKTPATMGTVRRPDRLLAAQLHQRGVPLTAIENALVSNASPRPARLRRPWPPTPSAWMMMPGPRFCPQSCSQGGSL